MLKDKNASWAILHDLSCVNPFFFYNKYTRQYNAYSRNWAVQVAWRKYERMCVSDCVWESERANKVGGPRCCWCFSMHYGLYLSVNSDNVISVATAKAAPNLQHIYGNEEQSSCIQANVVVVIVVRVIENRQIQPIHPITKFNRIQKAFALQYMH